MKDRTVRRILVPVDFSTPSAAALSFAYSLASQLGASIDVLHVMDPSDTLLTPADKPAAGDPAAARALLHTFVAEGTGDRVPIAERLESGDPRERIVAVAAADNIDMIVMGTHGRTGLSRLLMGSVAEAVVRRAPCPVITYKQKAHREAGKAG